MWKTTLAILVLSCLAGTAWAETPADEKYAAGNPPPPIMAVSCIESQECISITSVISLID